MASRTGAPALALRFAPAADAPAVHDLALAALDDHEPLAIHEQDDELEWLVFFRTPAVRDGAAGALRALALPGLLSLTPVDVPDEDWARRSQAHLRAIRIGRFIVAPPWDLPQTVDGGTIVLQIEPSTGFGTGHHQSTRLCLHLMQEMDLQGASVIDVGTGSGVLALAAVRLGARMPVTAMDEDPDALQNAGENAARNGLTGDVAFVECGLGRFAAAPADLVLANLTGAVITAHAGALRGLVAPGGRLVVSGFGPDELDEVSASLGTGPVTTASEGEWVGAVYAFARS